jgi:hypothetical protein
MANSTAPTKELGSSGERSARVVGWGGGPPSWSYFGSEALEHVPELKWKPLGKGMVRTYHNMRTDAQVQGLFLGSTLPVRRYNYALNKNGARARTLKRISTNYNIPIKGEEDKPRGRRKNRFKFEEHLRMALLALLYGHMYFEQSGEVGGDGYWNLRKLGPRMPATLMDIQTDDDGGLARIIQRTKKTRPSGFGSLGYGLTGQTPIPVNRLVAYIWEQEGGDWIGRSALRGIYKNWVVKDRVLRVGAINIERAGGVPVIRAPKGALQKDMDDLALMAQQFKIGEDSGGAIPHDAELMLAKAAGGDGAVDYIKLQNEEMGRGWLMMFLNLGQTTSGSRALGGSFIDLALNAYEAIAEWYLGIFNEHVIEDDVDWNEGPDAKSPIVGYTRNDDRQLDVRDFVSLVDKRIVTLDDNLEAWVRDEYQMPKRDPNAEPRQLPSPVPAPGETGAGAAAAVHSPLPSRSASGTLDDIGLDKDVLKQAIKEQLIDMGVNRDA